MLKQGLAGLLGLAPAAALAQPAIVSGYIGTAPVDVSRAAASPKFFLNIKGVATSIVVQFRSPSGSATGSLMFEELAGFTGPSSLGPISGNVTLQGYRSGNGGSGETLSPYAQPGLWTLTNVAVCGNTTPACSQYDSASALKAIFPSITFRVINPKSADFTPPVVAAGQVVTPTVSVSHDTFARLNLAASDNLSGVFVLSATAFLQGTSNNLFFQSSQPLAPVTKGIFKLDTNILPTTPRGSYTITFVTASDIAGNVTTITDAATITRIFGTGTTINVVE
jgi:hypothetical protein